MKVFKVLFVCRSGKQYVYEVEAKYYLDAVNIASEQLHEEDAYEVIITDKELNENESK